jgi:hypothetical protein
MAGRSSDGLLPQLHRILNLGAVGTMTDAQLLDWFVSRRTDAAQAAFDELMIRHGPMVFRVCRSVLQDRHDAEDAFQATFLVLAYGAGAVRRGGSVASWLFGVAHRVSSRAKSRAARQRALDEKAARLTPEAQLPNVSSAWEVAIACGGPPGRGSRARIMHMPARAKTSVRRPASKPGRNSKRRRPPVGSWVR